MGFWPNEQRLENVALSCHVNGLYSPNAGGVFALYDFHFQGTAAIILLSSYIRSHGDHLA